MTNVKLEHGSVLISKEHDGVQSDGVVNINDVLSFETDFGSTYEFVITSEGLHVAQKQRDGCMKIVWEEGH